jgi:hypothetical protein
MRRVSETAKKVVAGWVANMHEGDIIRFENGKITIYSYGCENDSVDAYAK